MNLRAMSTVESLRRPLTYHHIDAWGPPQYTNWVDEERSWKETCYLGDWSFLRSFRYTGPDAIKLFRDSSVNSMENFALGRSKHIIHTAESGKIIEEGILTRTGENEVVAHSTYYADHFRRHGDYDVEVEQLALTKYHLQGPNAVFVLENVLGREFRDLKFMHNTTVDINGVETIVLRQGMTGELGFELQAPTAEGKKVWDAILEAGAEYGIREMGGRVSMINHLQASYPTYGLDYLSAIHDEGDAYLAEMVATSGTNLMKYYYAIQGSFESDDLSDWYRSPVDLGWGNRVNFDHSFPGDAALKAEIAAPTRALCTLRWNREDIIDVYSEFFGSGDLPDFMEMPQDPRGYVYGDAVFVDGKRVGMSTSRGYSAHFREMLSLAVLDIDVVRPGTPVEVLWGSPGTPQRRIRAVTAAAPYKTDRARVDLHSLPPRS